MTMNMTQAQDDALKTVTDILREHFTGSLIAVQAEVGDRHDALDIAWHGGFATALGLAEAAKIRVLDSRSDNRRAQNEA